MFISLQHSTAQQQQVLVLDADVFHLELSVLLSVHSFVYVRINCI